MADNTRLVLIAVDDCDHSEKAFECEYRFYLCRARDGGSFLLTTGEMTIANVPHFLVPVAAGSDQIFFRFLASLASFRLATDSLMHP